MTELAAELTFLRSQALRRQRERHRFWQRPSPALDPPSSKGQRLFVAFEGDPNQKYDPDQRYLLHEWAKAVHGLGKAPSGEAMVRLVRILKRAQRSTQDLPLDERKYASYLPPEEIVLEVRKAHNKAVG